MTLRESGQRRVGVAYERSFLDRLRVLVAKEEANQRERARLESVRAEWEADADAVTHPFGLDWSEYDTIVCDVLMWVVPAGEHWEWIGRTNNKGLPVLRSRQKDTLNTERSAIKMIHYTLAADHDPPGAMHPRCDAPFICVRPSHRCPSCLL